MIGEEIREELFHLQDAKYRAFQAKLIPTAGPETFIGVRTPELRKYAKQLEKREDVQEFLDALPHRYFDENQLHAFLLVFRKHRQELLEKIRIWIRSDETYTIRFGVGMLMEHYLDEDFDPAYPEMAAGIRSEEYYVNMMRAWYFATALAKQYEAVIPFVENRRLDVWTHNKTIQKAVESYRITPGQKDYLKSLKVKR